MSDTDASRASRTARNQALYREINERVRDLNAAFEALDPVGDWVCECANPECVEGIRLTHEEYEAVRASGARFFVAPGDEHVFPEDEDVTDRRERYWVVEKRGVAAEIAAANDPRGPAATESA